LGDYYLLGSDTVQFYGPKIAENKVSPEKAREEIVDTDISS
jgi:hypothetical protein